MKINEKEAGVAPFFKNAETSEKCFKKLSAKLIIVKRTISCLFFVCFRSFQAAVLFYSIKKCYKWSMVSKGMIPVFELVNSSWSSVSPTTSRLGLNKIDSQFLKVQSFKLIWNLSSKSDVAQLLSTSTHLLIQTDSMLQDTYSKILKQFSVCRSVFVCYMTMSNLSTPRSKYYHSRKELQSARLWILQQLWASNLQPFILL